VNGCWEPLWQESLDSQYDPDGVVPFRGRRVHYDNAPFVFEDGFLRAGFQAVRLGTLKADAGHGVAMQGKVIDLKSCPGRHEHTLFDRRTGIGAAVATGAAVGDGQKMLFHLFLPLIENSEKICLP